MTTSWAVSPDDAMASRNLTSATVRAGALVCGGALASKPLAESTYPGAGKHFVIHVQVLREVSRVRPGCVTLVKIRQVLPHEPPLNVVSRGVDVKNRLRIALHS